MAARSDDAPLETLLLPFAHGLLQWPAAGTLFLRARYAAPLSAHAIPNLLCEQTFKPHADTLQRAGFRVVNTNTEQHALILLLPPRQRDEARALMARAMTAVRPGGRIIAAMSNDEGARSGETDLAQLAGPVESLVKNKCRVFWTPPLAGTTNPALLQDWLGLDAPRPVADGRFMSRPGLFAWDRIDVASALLADHLPADLAGHAADLGAGFGYLSAALLSRAAGIRSLHLYEAEKRALDLAQHNLAAWSQRVALEYRWHDVTTGLPHSYDVIVMNPPFHSGSRIERPDIGRRFISVAAAALAPGGRLWLVANRHLPYESVLDAEFGTVRTLTQQHGFKVIEAVKHAHRVQR